ncbi:hypothetical protein SK128_014175 [Halocaridina rubra]|uniref:Uncharacterized protein n=1 Tax=Halocaridina rubra TaxID=373956 RepID=A0AAN8XGD5_HALRR
MTCFIPDAIIPMVTFTLAFHIAASKLQPTAHKIVPNNWPHNEINCLFVNSLSRSTKLEILFPRWNSNAPSLFLESDNPRPRHQSNFSGGLVSKPNLEKRFTTSKTDTTFLLTIMSSINVGHCEVQVKLPDQVLKQRQAPLDQNLRHPTNSDPIILNKNRPQPLLDSHRISHHLNSSQVPLQTKIHIPDNSFQLGSIYVAMSVLFLQPRCILDNFATNLNHHSKSKTACTAPNSTSSTTINMEQSLHRIINHYPLHNASHQMTSFIPDAIIPMVTFTLAFYTAASKLQPTVHRIVPNNWPHNEIDCLFVNTLSRSTKLGILFPRWMELQRSLTVS